MCQSHAACGYLHLLQGRHGSIQGLSVLSCCLLGLISCLCRSRVNRMCHHTWAQHDVRGCRALVGSTKLQHKPQPLSTHARLIRG